MIASKPLHLHCCLLRRYSTFARFGGNTRTGWKRKTFRLGSALLAGGLLFCGYHALAPGFRVCECDQLPDYRVAIKKSRDLLRRVKDETGAPGIIVGVSIDGKPVWQEGLGYADIENRVLCTEDTVMRIASISKSITMIAVAKLWEEGKLDLDKPVQEYVPYFPKKTYEGKKVDITCRHLVSHLSGIRHYEKNVKKEQEKLDNVSSKEDKDNKNKSTKESQEELEMKEYFIKDKYENVKSALDLFKDDPLIHKPGTKFLYTTHGWTLVSAMVEAVVKEPFDVYICKLFKELGLTKTYLDINEPIIYHRSRHYCKDKKGKVQNTPYVDNSYKWAGGGFLSTVGDLLKFGNIMLYSLQYADETEDVGKISKETGEKQKTESPLPKKYKNSTSTENQDKSSAESRQMDECGRKLRGYLKRDTVKKLWTPVENTERPHEPELRYGMGWSVMSHKQDYGYCREQKFNASHTGLAVGACSILLILPRQCRGGMDAVDCKWDHPPQGTVIAVVTNLQGVGLRKVATEIAMLFDGIH
ncbi:serine beta-lactamase-like protein LACTB, mitochondrial isoform X2 [Centruroides vittatus]|uniref:serine beta-lactamase-like protein LACTB, mitochondrial isoform X2 n=1 Tax=Centruroides vittatus TaxID=120091 RepID=UPI00350FEB50